MGAPTEPAVCPALRSPDVFGETPDSVLAYLADVARERFLSDGEVFVHQGALEDAMFVVVDGEVAVDIDGEVIATLRSGAVVGEMQVIDPAPRSASVRARGDAAVLSIPKEVFDEAMAERPEIARAINRMLVRRLRDAQSAR